MVRFSCFAAHIPSTKSKKTSQLSAEMMHKASEEHSEVQSFKDLENSSGVTPLLLKVQEDSVSITSNHVTNFASIQRNWKSEEVKLPFQNESCVGVYKSRIHRSKSVGSGLHQNQRLSCGSELENETGQSVYSERSHDQSSSVISVGNKNPEPYPTDWRPEAPPASLHVGSGMVNDESIFLIGDPEQFEKGEKHENSDTQYSGQYAGESSNHSLHTPRIISKSRSLPNLFVFDGHSTTTHLLRRAASCENLDVLYSKRQEMFGAQIIQDVERDNDVKYNVENPADDCFDAYNHVGIAKDWIVPVMDEINPVNNPQAEPLFRSWEDLPSKDFKIKRIEEWISALESCSRFEEKHELSTSSDEQADAGVFFDVSSTGKQDGKITPGMEAAKRYVSSLSATATSAQLCNHGLVVIPFLSTFVSLKELNLSGNAIARITAGALPRGLHILNLSKNNISTIEGLRELTRLRVLDLSYNRILRIGHGLASCSSVKQLYLAGNKISEVEGLHRLLKLNVLDLRFNKISTTKCLGQLAANYNSLQAISLEGNPAQKNVGDEQLKKYLQSLLPHLAYFNRQSIKAGTLKDSADRSARLGISSHQIDRSLRSELKHKGNHGLSAHKRQSSSIHSRRCQQAVVLPKLPRDRQRRLAPSGIKTNVRPRVHDFGSKMLSFRPDLVLQRSHSEGNLGAH